MTKLDARQRLARPVRTLDVTRENMMKTALGGVLSAPTPTPRLDPDAEIESIRRANRELAHWPAWTRTRFENLRLELFDADGNHIHETEVRDGTRR